MASNFKRAFRVLVLAWLVLGLSHLFFSQSPEASLIKDLKWRNVGPANMVGRISDFEALDNDFTQVLVAARPAASGNPSTPERPGSRFSISTAPLPSATWPSFKRTRTSSGSAPARNASATASPGATGSINRPTAAKRSPGWGWRRLKRSARSSPILPIRISSMSRPAATLGIHGRPRSVQDDDGGKTWQKLAGGLAE